MPAQQIGNIIEPSGSGSLQRRDPRFVGNPRVRSPVQQQFHHLTPSPGGRIVEWSRTSAIPCINVRAPVKQGQAIGKLKVWRGDLLALEVPLQAAESVGAGSTTQRAFDAATELVINLFRAGADRL